MKKTLRKITVALVAFILTAGLLASAMADTIFMTEKFSIPAARIGGNRFTVTEEETEETPEEIPEQVPETVTVEDPVDTPQLPEEVEDPEEGIATENQEALDENVEGLVVVEGEEKSEVKNSIEQTEVRTEISDDNNEELSIMDPALNEDEEPMTTPETENELIPEELPKTVTYERDEDGTLVLDKRGNPIPIVPDGLEIPVKFQKDENGQLILDENGEPISLETVSPGSKTFAELIDALNPDRSVTMYINCGTKGYVEVGDTVELKAILYGYENAIYTLQWQCSKDNENWSDIDGETEQTMWVTATDENIRNWWRVGVIITDVVE